MDTYSLLREFADSWIMLGIFGFFIGACIWAFLPSQAKAREDASMIPLRNEFEFDESSEQPDASAASEEPKNG